MAVALDELVGYLHDYLRLAEVPDEPNALNGLQVERDGAVSRLAVAVDACGVTIDRAAAEGADLLLVHHGLFWAGLEPIAGRHYRRVRSLVAANVALYAAHIPLDVHPEVGNNAVLGRMLGLQETFRFGDFQGVALGVAGHLSASRDDLIELLTRELGATPHVIPAGPERVRRVGVITGGAGTMIAQARDAGLDTFITGEGPHYTHFDAEEWGLNVVYAGHYATETVGVKALAGHLAERFGVSWSFIDHPTGL